MASTRRYGEELRAIGQLVEAKDISDFEIKRLGSSYTIHGIAEETHMSPRWLRPLRSKSPSGFLIIGRP